MCFLREWFQTEASEHLLEGRAGMLAESVVEARAVREEEVQTTPSKNKPLSRDPEPRLEQLGLLDSMCHLQFCIVCARPRDSCGNCTT